MLAIMRCVGRIALEQHELVADGVDMFRRLDQEILEQLIHQASPADVRVTQALRTDNTADGLREACASDRLWASDIISRQAQLPVAAVHRDAIARLRRTPAHPPGGLRRVRGCGA